MDITYLLNLHLTSATQADAVLETFPLCEDISSAIISAEGFRRDWELLLEEIDVLNSFRDTADEITAGMEDLANTDPESPFSARFLVLNDSGDGYLVADYSYTDGMLHIQIMETMENIIAECPECGEELEEAIELEKHRHGKNYTCPECGAKFTFEV